MRDPVGVRAERMKRGNKGFTLMEMLIVVAIIAILVTIAIPSFTKLLEKSREAADMANVRSAYAEVMVNACLDGDEGYEKEVPLKQKINDWQTAETITIGDITHKNGDPDTANWIGNPVGGGICQVSYSTDVGIILNWKGGKSTPSIDFTQDLLGPLKNSGLKDYGLGAGGIKDTNAYEIDSGSINGSRTKTVQKVIDDSFGDTLLAQDKCSWGYYGNAAEGRDYLFWSSVDIQNKKKGDVVPVIIVTSGGKYYVTEVTVAKKKEGYNVLTDKYQYTNYVGTGDEYSSLEDAYRKYEQKMSQG